jgi:hypothetical protein
VIDTLTLVLSVAVWGLAPGLALLAAVRVPWSAPERAAAAPGLSLALVAIAAYLADAVSLPVAPAGVLLVVVGICVLAAVLYRAFDAGRLPEPAAGPAPFPGPWPNWAPWLVWLLPILVVRMLEPVLDLALLPPTLHDGLDHANWFRLIYETRAVDPSVVMAPPLAADGSPVIYPWGSHAWLALVAHTTTMEPAAVLMQGAMLISAAAPLSVYAFASLFVGRGWPAIGTAAFSLMFWWLPFQPWGWGGYPLLAGAVAALPLSRLALVAVERLSVAALLGAALCGLGVVTIHPSQAFVALIVATVVSVGLAASREMSWRAALVLIVALAAACGVLASGVSYWPPLAAFLERARGVGAAMTHDPRYRWPGGLALDAVLQFPPARRTGFVMLWAAGTIVALFYRRTRPLVALHLVFSALVPAAKSLSWLTSLWYHAPERIWYSQFANLPILAALPVAAAIALLTRRTQGAARWQAFGWLIALGTAAQFMYAPYAAWASGRVYLFAARNAQLTLTDDRRLADFAWIRKNVPRDQVLMNAPADWGISLPFTGLRTVFWSGGAALDPVIEWHHIAANIHRGGDAASQAAADLHHMGLRYVFVAHGLDPRMEVNNRLRFDGGMLAGTPGFAPLYTSPTARVLAIQDDGGVALGLDDSERLQFVAGFYGRERLVRHVWRWTNGAGRLRIRTTPGKDCYLRIFGPPVDGYELRAEGATLVHTSRGHRIPPQADGSVDVEILSKSTPPAPRDPRRLGVLVRNVALGCA